MWLRLSFDLERLDGVGVWVDAVLSGDWREEWGGVRVFAVYRIGLCS